MASLRENFAAFRARLSVSKDGTKDEPTTPTKQPPEGDAAAAESAAVPAVAATVSSEADAELPGAASPSSASPAATPLTGSVDEGKPVEGKLETTSSLRVSIFDKLSKLKEHTSEGARALADKVDQVHEKLKESKLPERIKESLPDRFKSPPLSPSPTPRADEGTSDQPNDAVETAKAEAPADAVAPADATAPAAPAGPAGPAGPAAPGKISAFIDKMREAEMRKKVSQFIDNVVDTNLPQLQNAAADISFSQFFTRSRSSTAGTAQPDAAGAGASAAAAPEPKVSVDLPAVIKSLSDGAEEVQVRAVQTISRLAEEELAGGVLSSDEDAPSRPPLPMASAASAGDGKEAEASKEAEARSLRKAQGLEALLKCLKSSSVSLQRSTCEALANLALDKERQQWIAKENVLPKLVAFLKAQGEPQLQLASCKVFRVLSQNPELRGRLVDEGVLDPLLALLRSPEEAVRVFAGKCLSHLAVLEDVQQQLGERGAVPALLAMLGDESAECRRGAARVLHRVAQLPRNRARVCDAGGMRALSAFVSQDLAKAAPQSLRLPAEGSNFIAAEVWRRTMAKAQRDGAKALALLTGNVEDHIDRLRFEVKAAEEQARRRHAAVADLQAKLQRADAALAERAAEMAAGAERADSAAAQLRAAQEAVERAQAERSEAARRAASLEEQLRVKSAQLEAALRGGAAAPTYPPTGEGPGPLPLSSAAPPSPSSSCLPTSLTGSGKARSAAAPSPPTAGPSAVAAPSSPLLVRPRPAGYADSEVEAAIVLKLERQLRLIVDNLVEYVDFSVRGARGRGGSDDEEEGEPRGPRGAAGAPPTPSTPAASRGLLSALEESFSEGTPLGLFSRPILPPGFISSSLRRLQEAFNEAGIGDAMA
eukprot:tig00000178_g12815.t1